MIHDLKLLIITDDRNLSLDFLNKLEKDKIATKVNIVGSEESERIDEWLAYFGIVLIDVIDIDCYTMLDEINLPQIMLFTENCTENYNEELVNVLRITSYPVYFRIDDPKLLEDVSKMKFGKKMDTDKSNRMNVDFVQSTLGALGDGVIVANFSGEIEYMNQMARSITKYFGSIQEVDFNRVFNIINPNECYCEDYFLDRMKQKNHPFGLHRDAMMLDQEGNMKYISATLSPLEVNRRGLVGLVVVFRDINRIRESEKRLHLYSEAIKQSMEALVITNEEFVVESANGIFLKSFDVDKEAVIGNCLFDLAPFETSLKRHEVENGLLESEAFRKNISTDTNGNKGHFRVVLSPVFDSSTVYYLVALVDMTKQIDMETQLEKERENLNTIFEGLPLGVIIMTEDLAVTKVNREAIELFDIGTADVLGKHFGEAIGCGTKSELCSKGVDCTDCAMKFHIERAFIEQEAIRGEEVAFKIAHKSGGHLKRWFRLSVVPFQMAGINHAMSVFEDVTEQKEIADSLIQNEFKLRLITDNMIDTITQVDTSGNIVYASPSHWNLMGYSPEYLIGKNLFNFIHPEDADEARSKMRERIESGKSFSTELRLKRKDGKYIWLESVGNLLKEADDELTLIYVSRDISVKREVLQQMQKSKEAAESANKAKSEFLANMSHEIRTPMNGIIGMTNLTLMSSITDDQRENLNMVRSSAENLLKIINSILDFSKIEAGKIVVESHSFNLKHIIEKTLSPIRTEALNKDLDIRYEIDPTLSQVVKGDSNRLIQIFNNLVGNAMKFTHKGEVVLRVKKKEVNHNTAVVRFEVADTGIGIAKEHHEKLFESFSQVDGSMTRKYGGTGLGLTITKQLVELMGGQIGFESEVGKGSVFCFDIPLLEVESSASEKKVSSLAVPTASKVLKVLLAEDDPINQTLAMRLLERQKHQVVIANNGLEVIEALKRESFDIILMDISMPVMNGLEATSYIRDTLNLRDLPIVALTAHAMKDDQEHFLSSGMDAYIAKPIDLNHFYNTIERVTTTNHIVESLIKKAYELDETVASVEEIYEFHEELKIYTLKIENAIRECRFSDVEDLAHYLKTLATTVGDRSVRTWALKLELDARKEDQVKLEVTFSKLVDEMKRIERGLA
ncbi:MULTISPECIES: PAS domain S-box protein [unclassified Fusibacter]|uniref:PAS domain S-box protein n=1 Tax=unclassified Fusibacter TaxID=2624464 RepID=UPI0010110C23|nr:MULTISPECIES: PAS domain S-box protein [unclassified Fusibacter]MCK8061385.1 PAS domain S-box protein [Fusibacter sp. A2]NPE23572.1 PAS domain S-box protein [Fusibacter sp. A1]RXV58982.1 PAS domain S-box protein [Fusibacter sp. A1]